MELACGTGDHAVALARLVSDGGDVTGADLSDMMISEGRRRTGALDLPLTFEVRDAQVPPFLDGAFDAVRYRRSGPNPLTHPEVTAWGCA